MQRLVQILSGIKVHQGVRRRERPRSARFDDEIMRYFRRALRVVRNRVYSRSLVEFMTQAVMVGVLVLGIWAVLGDFWGLTLGTLIAFSFVSGSLYRPLKALTQLWNTVHETTPVGGAHLRSARRRPRAARRGRAPGRSSGSRAASASATWCSTTGARRCCAGSTSRSPPARPSRWSARRARARPPSPTSCSASTTPSPARSSSTASTRASSRASSLRELSRRRHAGAVPVRHLDPREHPLRPARGESRRDRRRRARRERARVHREAARRLRDAGRRARRPALRRPAPADHHRARDPARPAAPDPGRADVGARRDLRAGRAGRDREPDEGPDGAGDRAPAAHRAVGRRDRRARARRDQHDRHARRARASAAGCIRSSSGSSSIRRR